MKNPILTTCFLFFILYSFGSPTNIAVTNNGSWASIATWDLNRLPATGDTVVIPFGKTVILNTNQNIPGSLFIKIYGVLKLSNGILDLGNTATIMVYAGGKIAGSGCACEQIRIGNIKKFQGDADVLGPQYANSSTNDFDPILVVLPVKFVSFSVTSFKKDVLVQWSTSMEISAQFYVIERSFNGLDWSNIYTVIAKGNSSVLTHYSYTDRNISGNVVYYRIKQVDTDGRFTYTSIKKVQSETNNTSVQITSVHQHILIQFAEEVKGNVTVQVVSLNGQVVDHQVIRNPVGQVVLNTRFKGNYVVSISNAQSLHVAKQIIL